MHFKKEISSKDYLGFLLPSVLVLMFISTYTIIDGYFISAFVGPNALASVNLIMPINSMVFAIGLMFAAGGGAMASIKLGENAKKKASQYFSNLLVMAFGLGLAIMLLSFFFHDQLLNFLGVNQSLWQDAKTYSIYSILTFPFLITKVIYAGFLRAEGNPKISLIMTILGGIANLVLDYLFIVVFKMGVAGAGLGTMAGIIIALIYGTSYYGSEKATLRFGFYTLDFTFLKKAIFNGSSEMVSELAIGFTALVFNLLSLKYAGNNGVAAISVILYIHLFVGNSFQGFAIGTAPLLSYHYGAGNVQTLKRVMHFSRWFLLITSPLVVVISLVAKSPLVSFFFDEGHLSYSLAVNGLFIFSFGFLLVGYNMYGSAMYTALSNGKVSAIISFSKSFILFPLAALILPELFGIMGIWLIMPVVETITAILVFYLTRQKQLTRFVKIHFDAPINAPQNQTPVVVQP